MKAAEESHSGTTTSKHFAKWAISSACVLIALTLFIGLKPGVLPYDSNFILNGLLNGRLTNLFSPTYQDLWYCVLPLTKSQWPILFVTITFYWLGVCLMSLAMLRYGPWHAVFVLFVALMPETIYMTHVVNTDVAANSAIVFLIGYCLWCVTGERVRSTPGCFIGASIALLFVALMRYNAVVVVPIFSLMIGWIFFGRSWRTAIAVGVVVTILVVSIEGLVARSLVGEKQTYVDNLTVPYDLISVSIELGHQGVTADFDAESRRQLEKIYATTGWYSRFPRYDELMAKDLSRSHWFELVWKHPLTYLKMRWNTFSKMFDGRAHPDPYHVLFQWPPYRNRYVTDFLLSEMEQRSIPKSAITRPDQPLNAVQTAYGNSLTWYFKHFPQSWVVPAIGALTFVLTFLILPRNRQNPLLIWVFCLLAAAAVWYFSILFIVQKPMTRYVYPANCLVLFSFPVFLAAVITMTKRNH